MEPWVPLVLYVLWAGLFIWVTIVAAKVWRTGRRVTVLERLLVQEGIRPPDPLDHASTRTGRGSM